LKAEEQSSYAVAVRQNNELIQELYDLFDDDLSHEVMLLVTMLICVGMESGVHCLLWYEFRQKCSHGDDLVYHHSIQSMVWHAV